VISGTNPAGSFPGLRPNLVGNPVLPHGKRSIYEWFNTTAFSVVNASSPGQPITVGTAGRNLVTGPGDSNLDSSVAKDFKVRERYTLQIRLEAFNSFNSEHYNGPGADASQLGFGEITSNVGSTYRVAQLAAKILF
jgi:hypothetical protein